MAAATSPDQHASQQSLDASHVSWDAAYKSVVRRLATCLKWEGGSITSAKAKGPLNIKGLSLWLAYRYMQLLVTHVYVSMIEGVSLNFEDC